MRGTYVASFISFVSISTKNEWNEENAGFDGGGGESDHACLDLQ